MTAYRDQYASVFKDGQNVVMIGISDDSPEVLHSWAKDADFQFLFGSDAGNDGFIAFGGVPRDNGQVGSRAVIVIDTEGRISSVTDVFNQNDPMAYEQLARDIAAVTPEAEGTQ